MKLFVKTAPSESVFTQLVGQMTARLRQSNRGPQRREIGLGAAGFGELLDLVDRGSLDPGVLVTGRIPLSEAGDALAAMDGVQPPGITVIDRLSE